MSFAYLALGFGLGVLSMALLTLVGGAIAAGTAWRWARAFERAGIDVSLKPEEVTQGGS
jgi:hypothetical protein